jgi:hypothetical protein
MLRPVSCKQRCAAETGWKATVNVAACLAGLQSGQSMPAAQSAVRHCFFLLDVSQTDYSLLMCSLTMCTHSVMSC